MQQYIALPCQYNHVKEVSINGIIYTNVNYSFDNETLIIPLQQLNFLQAQ
jgi:hypothetical protein